MNVRELHQRLCDLVHQHGDRQVLVYLHSDDEDLTNAANAATWVIADINPLPEHPTDQFITLVADEERCDTCGFLAGPPPNHHPDCPDRSTP